MARRLTSQVLTGAVVVVVGVLLLVDTTGVFEVDQLFTYVPSLFVLLGLYAVVASGFRNLVGPLLVVLVAVAWQLVALDVVTGDEVVQFWPVLVIVFGLSLLLGPYRRSRSQPATGSEVNSFAIFGGSEKRVTSEAFAGGELTAVFGGAVVDLRDAEIAEPPAHVSAIALFGGVEIRAPEEWNVELDVLPILGGASDDRPRPPSDATPREGVDLVVSGFAAFGGVSVE